jgi:hypothetical protein
MLIAGGFTDISVSEKTPKRQLSFQKTLVPVPEPLQMMRKSAGNPTAY